MSQLVVFWIAVLVLAALTLVLFSTSETDGELIPRWRALLAGWLLVGVVGTAIITRVTPELHACQTTIVRTVTGASAESVNQETQTCAPPLDAFHVTLLLVPVIALVAPALSEFTIAGLFSAKLREIAEREAQTLFVTHELGSSFVEAFQDSETGEDLGDLPED